MRGKSIGPTSLAVAGLVGLAGLVGAQAGAQAAAPAREPGIYLEKDQSATPELVKLEPSTLSRTGTKDMAKTMATSMLTGGMLGGKPKMAFVFAGARATLRVPAQAYFHFYFDPKAASSGRAPNQGMDQEAMMAAALEQMGQGDSGMPYGVAHPKEFVLARLEVKNDERQLVASMDMKPKGAIPCRIRTVPDGYRVFTDHPLEPGEYGFFAVPKNDGTGGGVNKLWDFGVDPR